MNKFIAYFDILGYKEYIYTKEERIDLINRDMEHLLRDTQLSLAGNKLIPKENVSFGLIPDLENKKVNCLNISDSIVFWTNDDSKESFNDIFEVSKDFYLKTLNGSKFLLRGSLGYGSLEYRPSQHIGEKIYAGQLLYGKALIETYIVAETQQSASFCLSESMVTFLGEYIKNLESQKQIIKNTVFFKNEVEPRKVYLIPPIKGWFNAAMEQVLKNRFIIIKEERVITEEDFAKMKDEVKLKMDNTINLLKRLDLLLN
jgi:hypothetical protein